MRKPTEIEVFFERVTSWVGSLPSLALHTVIFAGSFGIAILGLAPWDMVLLTLTTIVSLEAIYLAIFIQMTINRQARQIAEVGVDVEDIQENVEEISKDLDEIQEDVEEIQEDAKEISADVEGIQEQIGQIEENVEDLSEELEKDDREDAAERTEDQQKIAKIEHVLEELLREIKTLKQ